KQRLFARTYPDRDNQPVAEGDGVPDHVQMTVGDGVEGAGIKRDTGHMPPLACPTPAGKVAPPGQGSRKSILPRPMNHLRPRRVFLVGSDVSSGPTARNKTGPGRNHFPLWRRRPETGLGY